MAIKEYEHLKAVERIERENLRAAYGQELLDLLVIHSFLEDKARSAGETAGFWQVLRMIESLFEVREAITAFGLPVYALSPVQSCLLFNCEIPQVGDKINVRVPRVLPHTSINAACCVADGLKKKRSELKAEQMLARLNEAEARWRKCVRV